MSRVNIEGNRQQNNKFGPGFQFRSMSLVPADNFQLTVDHPPLIFATPAGAIDMLMPTSTEARKGLAYLICNLSANAITLKTDGDAAFTAAIVIATGQMAWVVCTGSTTQAVGWRAASAAGTQTSP